jgi:hypothetical protein
LRSRFARSRQCQDQQRRLNALEHVKLAPLRLCLPGRPGSRRLYGQLAAWKKTL